MAGSAGARRLAAPVPAGARPTSRPVLRPFRRSHRAPILVPVDPGPTWPAMLGHAAAARRRPRRVLTLPVGISVTPARIFPRATARPRLPHQEQQRPARRRHGAGRRSCKGTERPLDWNTKGATGPAGPAGVSAAFEARGGNVERCPGPGLWRRRTRSRRCPGLAPGAYVVQAKLNVTGPGTTIARVVCETTLGGVTDEGIVSNGSQGGFSGQQSIKMQLAVTT